MASQLRHVRLADASDESLQRFHSELLEPSFPPHELVSLADLARSRAESTTGGVLVMADERPVAGIVTDVYAGGRVLLVSYLVVAADLRGSGMGAKLLAGVRFHEPAGTAPLVLAEVEDPRFYAADDRIDPYARLRFYAREGARLLPLDYAQPSLRPGSPRAENLLLVALTDAGDVDSASVAQFLEEYFTACEGAERLAGDGHFQRLRQTAASGARLPLTSLDDPSAARPGPDAS